MVGDTEIMRTFRTTNAHVKGQGLTEKFLSNEHSFQHVFICLTTYMCHFESQKHAKKITHMCHFFGGEAARLITYMCHV